MVCCEPCPACSSPAGLSVRHAWRGLEDVARLPADQRKPSLGYAGGAHHAPRFVPLPPLPAHLHAAAPWPAQARVASATARPSSCCCAPAYSSTLCNAPTCPTIGSCAQGHAVSSPACPSTCCCGPACFSPPSDAPLPAFTGPLLCVPLWCGSQEKTCSPA